MSNFIPMVSSSPPPLEDSGGFDDWGDDDDDFGTFTGANNNSDFTPFQSDNNTESDGWKNKTSNSEFENFADFGNMSSSTENITNTTIIQKDVDVKNKPSNLNLEKSDSFKVIPNSEKECSDFGNENANDKKEEFEFKDDVQSENTNNIMRNTTRDSGIFSTDISPSPVSDMKPNLQDELKGSQEIIYDSPSEDSASIDLSETVDLNEQKNCENTCQKEVNNSYISETSECHRVSPTKDSDSNEIDSLNQGISSCDLELPVSALGTVLEHSNDTKSLSLFDDTRDTPKSDQDVDIDIQTSPSQNSFNDSLKDECNEETSSTAAEDKLVQNDSDKQALENPPTTSNCDNNLTFVEESSLSVTHSIKDSDTFMMADSSSVKDSGIEMSDSVIEKEVIATEDGNLSSDNCSDENKDNIITPESDIYVESSQCSIEVEENDGETSGYVNSEYPKNSSENIDDSTECQQPEECFDNQCVSLDNKIVENVEIAKEIVSEVVLNSQTDSSEKVDSSSNTSETSEQESCANVTSDANLIKESLNDEGGKIFKGYDSSKNLNLKVGREEDIDDDFADFQTVSEFTTSEKTKTDLNEESESNWGFQNAPAVNGNEGGDWANFEEPAVSLNAKNDVDDDDDDDFGDFGDFSENTDFNSFTPQTQENFKSAASPTTESDKPLRVEPGFKANLFSRQRKVSESIVDDVVDEMIKESDNVIPDMLSELNTIDTCLMSKETAVKVTKVKSKDNPELWTKLKNLNSTTAIKYQWPDSSVNKKLFTTLKIDTQNILLGHRKQHVPIYASNLTMLEPTKGPIAPKSNSDPQLVDTDQSKVQQIQNINMEIPPVQFDWTTSGLTNPLEENRKTLGLDFLVVQETEATSRSTVLSGDSGQQEVKTSLQPLENILATLKVSTVKKTKHTDNLGQEAAKIITSLPDLSFMQAKVLMFPLRQQNNN